MPAVVEVAMQGTHIVHQLNRPFSSGRNRAGIIAHAVKLNSRSGRVLLLEQPDSLSVHLITSI